MNRNPYGLTPVYTYMAVIIGGAHLLIAQLSGGCSLNCIKCY